MERTDELKERIRQQPLNDRLEESRRRIGDMCSKGRCPKMTIPVQHDDDDFYINTTLADAQATIAALQARVKELEEWVQDQSTANLEKMRHMDEMQSRAMEAESQLTQRTAELEAAITRAHEAESKATELSVKLQQAREERDNLRLRILAVDKEHEQLAVDRQKMTSAVESLLTERDDLQAGLKRVRGELAEATHNANVYQSLYSTGCMDRALLENELRDAKAALDGGKGVQG